MLSSLFLAQYKRKCMTALGYFAQGMVDEYAWNEVAEAAKSIAFDPKSDVKRRIEFDNDRPKDVVGDLLAIVCLEDIESGKFNTYRGVLSLAGQSRASIFRKVIEIQLEDGWIDQSAAEMARTNLSQAIRNSG